MHTPTRTRRAVRRVAIPTAVLLVGSLAFAVAGTGTASASSTQCDPAPGAALTFTGTFSNGQMKLGSATGSGLAAQACGSIFIDSSGNFSTSVQPADIAFSPVSVKILFLSLPATVTVNAPLSGPVALGADLSSADISLTANISASAKLLGFNCVIGPITPTLTTGPSGSLHGTTFTGSFVDGFKGKVVAGDFAVPGIKASKSCPGLIAGLSNVLVGLPAAKGKASISMDGVFAVNL